MKLFEYWTELPYSITQMIPELPKEIIEYSTLINNMAQKIIASQKRIIEQLEEIQMNNLSSFNKILLSQKLDVIEREKTNLAFQAIKNTTKILTEASKNLERVSTPNKENLTQIKLSLRITRSILEKINEETSFALSNKKSSYEEQISNKSKSSCSLPFVNRNYIEKVENNENSDNLVENQGVENFLTMFSCFVEKIQSKLFMKSNDLLSALIEINQKPEIHMEQMESQVHMLNLNEFKQKVNSKPNSCKNVSIGKMMESNNSGSELKLKRRIKRKNNQKIIIQKKESNFRKKNFSISSNSFNSEISVDNYSSRSTTNSINISNSPSINNCLNCLTVNPEIISKNDNLVNSK